MSWSRALAAIVVAAFLSACGFTPVYAPDVASARFSSVEIGNIPDSDGQYLRNALIDRIYTSGRPQQAAYSLLMSRLVTEKSGIGVGKDASSTRVQMKVHVIMTLIDNATQARVLERELRAFGGYNVFAGQYATIASAEAAKKWALDDLANQAMRELGLYFNRPPGILP